MFDIYVAALNSPWVLIIVPIVFTILFLMLKFYMKTYRDLSRLESVTHSPIVSHLGETISGATTIRTFNKQKEFIERNYKILNENTNVVFYKNAIRRWFAIRLEIVLVTIIVFTSGFCVSRINMSLLNIVGIQR